MASKWVYQFSEGNKNMKELLGGKGANLAEMTSIGLPVPPGFTITTEVCNHYSAHGGYPEGVDDAGRGRPRRARGRHRQDLRRRRRPAAAQRALRRPRLHARHDGHDPQPGPQRHHGPGRRRDHRQPALRLRLLPPLRQHVRRRRARLQRGRRIEVDVFEERLEAMKKAKGVEYDTDLTADDLKELVAEFKAAVKETTGNDFPDDPLQQLWGAISAVFGSWDNDRAVAYRRLYDIPDDWGTAVNVQTMVYGNTGEESGTGVAFTRNPASGENEFYGEFLVNAQGEDVVAGVRTPRPAIELAEVWPDVYAQLMEIRKTLESEMRDMQDFEFTIEKGRLFMLQTRNGKRTGLAAIRIAVDLADQGLISPDEALMRIEPEQLNQLLRPIFGPEDKQRAVAEGRVKAKGLPAGPGAASRPRRLQRCRRRGLGRARRAGAARPRLHQPQGHPRHGRRPGHTHGAGRHDQPRRARRPADGQGLHRRLWRPRHRHEGAQLQGRRRHGQRGRLDQHRRLHRRGHPRSARDAPPRGAAGAAREEHEARRVRVLPLLRRDHGVGRQDAHDGRAHERRPARPEQRCDRLRR